MNDLSLTNNESKKSIQQKEIDPKISVLFPQNEINKTGNEEGQNNKDKFFLGKKRFVCSGDELKLNNINKKEDKNIFLPNKVKNIFTLITNKNSFIENKNKNNQEKVLVFEISNNHDLSSKINNQKNNKLNHEINSLNKKEKEFNIENKKEEIKNNIEDLKRDCSNNNLIHNTNHSSHYIKNEKNSIHNNNEIKQVSNSLSHSSRFINKKNFIEEICFICNNIRKDCIIFESKLDFYKYLSSLIVVRKSRKEFGQNELNILNNNFSMMQKMISTKYDTKVENEIYKTKYWCIQCLIDIISSENIYNLLIEIENDPKSFLKSKNPINFNDNNILINQIKKDNNMNQINFFKFDNKINFNTNNKNIRFSNGFNFNYGYNQIIPLDSFINDLPMNLRYKNNFINNKNIINSNNLNTSISLENINLDLMKIYLSLHQMIQFLLELKKNNNKSFLKHLNISKNEKDFNIINKNISTSLSMLNDYINYSEIINRIKNELKKLFELGFNIVIQLDKYLSDIENKLIERKDNYNLLIEQISNLKFINKENCFKLIDALNNFITITNLII